MPRNVRSYAATPLLLAFLALLSGCAAQALPGMVGDPQAPPSAPADVPLAGADEGVVVEYFVLCDECTATFTTPNGPGTRTGIEGSFRRRVRFGSGSAQAAVTLIATPMEGVAIRAARIRVDQAVRAEAGQQAPGRPVDIYASIR